MFPAKRSSARYRLAVGETGSDEQLTEVVPRVPWPCHPAVRQAVVLPL